MKIEMITIPHDAQRYDTCGDWEIGKDGSISISVSDMGNEDYALLVALHELVEVWFCRKRGISQKSVDDFDIAYENARKDGDISEPGDSTKAPYFLEHRFATKIERQVAAQLGVNWEEYDNAVNDL